MERVPCCSSPATKAFLVLALLCDASWNLDAFRIPNYKSTLSSSAFSSTDAFLRHLSSLSSSFLENNDENDKAGDYPSKWIPGIRKNTPNSNGTPNKLNVYGEAELSNLLNLHQQLYPLSAKSGSKNGSGIEPLNPNESSSDKPFPGIHDMVLEMVKELEVVDKVQKNVSSVEPTNGAITQSLEGVPLPTWLPRDVQDKMKYILAIASDVDGTIIGSEDHTVHVKTKRAIQRAVEASYSPIHKLKWFFPATGKSRAGAFNSLGPELAALLSQGPGVFIQGLYCVNGGNVIFEKKLPTPVICATERLVAESLTSIIAYDGDKLLTNNLTDSVVELHEIWGEPLSEEIPSVADYPPGVHKILICDHDLEKLVKVRVKLEELAREHDCVVTQAIPTMLELLPSGCSKALGVQKLCEELGIDPETQLLAVGDAENDVGMLKMAAVGCAVNDANDLAKRAADVVVPLSSSEGGAGLAFEVIGGV